MSDQPASLVMPIAVLEYLCDVTENLDPIKQSGKSKNVVTY